MFSLLRRFSTFAQGRLAPNCPRQRRHGVVPTVEVLEERCVPTTFTVNNVSDGTVTGPGQLPGSLRQAVFDANGDMGNAIIQFDPTFFATPRTITLSAG
jgi:hypothetical protein